MDLSLREEVISYIRACERLISSAAMPGYPKFSDDERQVIEYYASELLKTTTPALTAGEERDTLI